MEESRTNDSDYSAADPRRGLLVREIAERLKIGKKVRRELYGSRPERTARLLDQMEMQLEELEADAGEDKTLVRYRYLLQVGLSRCLAQLLRRLVQEDFQQKE